MKSDLTRWRADGPGGTNSANPDARRRAIVAALIAVGVIAVLAIATWSRGGNG
ncbi:MAG: hypothetical protein R2848_13220 [Thermomicrobiales bacterium]